MDDVVVLARNQKCLKNVVKNLAKEVGIMGFVINQKKIMYMIYPRKDNESKTD